MFDAGKADIFLGLLTPHGLLELTAVFLAGARRACGLAGRWCRPATGRVGRCWRNRAEPWSRSRSGLVVVLLVPGLIEALVTPSPLPTFVRIAIGVAAEIAFLAYVFHFGRKAAAAGESGDVDDAPDVVPTS